MNQIQLIFSIYQNHLITVAGKEVTVEDYYLRKQIILAKSNELDFETQDLIYSTFKFAESKMSEIDIYNLQLFSKLSRDKQYQDLRKNNNLLIDEPEKYDTK